MKQKGEWTDNVVGELFTVRIRSALQLISWYRNCVERQGRYRPKWKSQPQQQTYRGAVIMGLRDTIMPHRESTRKWSVRRTYGTEWIRPLAALFAEQTISDGSRGRRGIVPNQRVICSPASLVQLVRSDDVVRMQNFVADSGTYCTLWPPPADVTIGRYHWAPDTAFTFLCSIVWIKFNAFCRSSFTVWSVVGSLLILSVKQSRIFSFCLFLFL